MITTRERTLVACVMAIGNYGLHIDEHLLQDMVGAYREGQTTDDLINIIASPYMADIQPETAFAEEASGWFINLHGKTWDDMFSIWLHHTTHFNLIKNTDPSRQT